MQKSCINWLSEGDRITAFHHMSTIVRRQRNRISYIKNDMGEWIHSELGAMNYIREGFSKLFTTTLNCTPFYPPHPSTWQAILSEEDKLNLSMLLLEVKIKEGLWVLKHYKGPGPDGLHAGCIQRFWLIVRDSIRNEVKKIFNERKIPKYLNRTNIVIIPKITGPESVGN